MDNKQASLIISDSQYINLIRSITKRFKTEADSNLGLIVINEVDFKILFVNTSLLKFVNKQWTDLISESISCLLTIDDYNKLAHSHKQSTFDRLLGRSSHFVSGSIEIEYNDTRATINMHHLCICVDNQTYDIIYGVTSSPLINNLKCVSNSLLDPWINSLTRLMYTITDDYSRFWLFVLGVVTSIIIAEVTLYVTKPSFICDGKPHPIEQITNRIKKPQP